MNLAPRQKQLYDLLLGRGDVLIPELFIAMDGPDHLSVTTASQQRWLSPYIANLNSRLEGLKVEPGALKNTYRLVATSS